VIGLALAAWVAQPRLTNADPILFKVPLSGGQEVPPVFPAGAGTGDIGYDPATRTMTWTVTYRALSSTVTKAEFHGPAQPGKNAPAVVSLVKPGNTTENPITGQVTLSPDQTRQFAAGEWYVNIATQDHPEGEIRGQILPPLPSDANPNSRQRSRRSK
jgi:CHRD domain